MRPIFDAEPPHTVITDYGMIIWDAANARPTDYLCQAGRLYAQALADNGMTAPDPYVAPPAAVPNITKRQALLLLLSLGKTEADVIAAINSISDATAKAQAQISWDYPDGGMLIRSNPLFDQLGAALGFTTSAQMDEAFSSAASL